MTETMSQAVARRVRERRQELGWSVRRLAEECRRVGYPKITEAIITNMDYQRRDSVPVDEVDVFAQALSVPPEWLMYGDPSAARLKIAPSDAALADYHSAVRRVVEAWEAGRSAPDQTNPANPMVKAFAVGMAQLMLRFADDLPSEQIRILEAPHLSPAAKKAAAKTTRAKKTAKRTSAKKAPLPRGRKPR